MPGSSLSRHLESGVDPLERGCKQATVEDSGVTLQNTVDDVEKHLMSLVAVNIKYNVQKKNITEIGPF